MTAGQSIGDLFVKLGFDVDDAKLKSFDASIKDVFGTILKFAGVGGGIAGFVGLAKGAEETAVQIANLTTVYGASAKAIQAWGAAVHESNPLKSYAEGIASFGNIAEYLKNAAYTPQGTIALNRLGVQFKSDDVQHPERIIDKLFETIPKLLAAHPEQRGLYSSLVGDVTGDPTNLRIFEKGKDFQNAAGARVSLYQQELDDTVKVAQDIAALQNEWDKFYKHAMGTLAGGILELQKNIKEHGFVEGIGMSTDELGAADPYNIAGVGKALIHNPVMDGLVEATSKGIQGLIYSNRAESREFWQNKGYKWGQVAAWLGQEEAESAGNPRAKNGKFEGLFQWSPERRAAILKGTGIDISTAGHHAQLEAADWEFRHMGLEDEFKKRTGSRDASKFLSDKFEIHEKYNKQHGDETKYRQNLAEKQEQGMTVNVTQVINSNADAHEIARISEDRFNRLMLGRILNTPEHGMTNTLDDLIVGLQSYIVAPINAFGMGGLVFDLAGEARAQLSNDITDHYAEDNRALNDHIAVGPKRITLKGYVGELVYTQESQSTSIQQKVVQKLTTVSAYLPQLSAAVQQAQQVLADPVNSDITLVSAAGQLPGAANIYALIKNSLNASGSSSRQQSAYNYFDACRQQGIMMGIQTPWEFLTNMVVETIDAIQTEDTIFVTDFSVTFKQLRIASTKTAANPLIGNGGIINGKTFSQTVSELQGAATTSQGIVPGVTLPSSLLSNLGSVSNMVNAHSLTTIPGLQNLFSLQ